jgi:hypothetical protein
MRTIFTTKYLIALSFSLSSIFLVAQPNTGNITTKFSKPKGDPVEFTHNQDVGSDRLLVVITWNPTGTNASGVTYNGVSMTNELSWNNGGGVTNKVWYLASPAEGTNDVVVTYPIWHNNNCGLVELSYTN